MAELRQPFAALALTWLLAGSARLVQSRGEGRSELLVRAGATFRRDAGGAIAAAPEAALELVHGHAVHRLLLGVRLPFLATFVQSGQRFVHHYQAVRPFRLAPGASLPAEPAALAARLGDLAALAASHEEVLAAQRERRRAVTRGRRRDEPGLAPWRALLGRPPSDARAARPLPCRGPIQPLRGCGGTGGGGRARRQPRLARVSDRGGG